MAQLEIDLRIDNIIAAMGAIGNIAKELGKPKNRRKIAEAGAPLVVSAIQGQTPLGTRIHKRYKTAKLIGRKRAPKGMGNVVATYVPGNLRKSTMDLGEYRRRYKRLGVVIIGPVYRNKSKGKNIGRSKRNADGYYAHMILGSSLAYQRQIAVAGAKKVEKTAVMAMLQEANNLVDKIKLEQGLK